jgi:hypothetical protein
MSSPEKQSYDDQLVIQYLLGSMSEGETERLDHLSVGDDEFAAHLTAVEDDLVDAYVRGELSGKTLERFQSFYLSGDIRREKVRFAEAFLVSMDRSAASATGRRDRSSRWVWKWSPVWGFAAAACMMLLAGGYLLRENLRLRTDVARAQAEQARLQQREQELRRQLDDERAGAAKTSAKPQTEKSAAPLRAMNTVAFVLRPQTRGAGSAPTVSLPPGTDRVLLQLNLESDEFAGYQVALRDPASNQIVWRSARVKATSRGESKAVSVSLPAALLSQQHYVMELTGIAASGASEFVSSYPFQVRAG